MTPYGALAMEYLTSFIEVYRSNFRPKRDWVFPLVSGERVSGPYLGEIVRGHSKRCGLQIHPHALRHAAATHMMRKGADVRAIQLFLGHKDIGSTEIYTRVDLEELRGVVDKMGS